VAATFGAKEKPTELPSGIVAMGARVYDPYTGTFLQTDPIPGADANAYGYTDGDPINEVDLTGQDAAAVGAAEGAGALCSETLFGAFVCAVVAYGGTTALEAIAGSGSSSSSSSGPPAPPHTGSNGQTGVVQARSNPDPESAEEQGKQTVQEGNAILGRAHSNTPQQTQNWNDWWQNVSKPNRKYYDQNGGRRPQKRN
jgi:RHS repeat-associated protein